MQYLSYRNLGEPGGPEFSIEEVKAIAAKTIGLRSIAYNYETIQGKVYIVGVTSRPEQLEDIIDVAKTVKGVIEIVNYVIIKE